jgi:hypothetical protein
MKAGDSLRAIYDQLSADPNSLANLDQVCVVIVMLISLFDF